MTNSCNEARQSCFISICLSSRTDNKCYQKPFLPKRLIITKELLRTRAIELNGFRNCQFWTIETAYQKDSPFKVECESTQMKPF